MAAEMTKAEPLTHIGGDLWARKNGRYLDICDRSGKVLLFISRSALAKALQLAPPEEET